MFFMALWPQRKLWAPAHNTFCGRIGICHKSFKWFTGQGWLASKPHLGYKLLPEATTTKPNDQQSSFPLVGFTPPRSQPENFTDITAYMLPWVSSHLPALRFLQLLHILKVSIIQPDYGYSCCGAFLCTQVGRIYYVSFSHYHSPAFSAIWPPCDFYWYWRCHTGWEKICGIKKQAHSFHGW